MHNLRSKIGSIHIWLYPRILDLSRDIEENGGPREEYVIGS